MSSLITNLASPEASGEADSGIVETYKARLQALGYSSGLTGKCIRTVLHLITWLSANGTGIEALDVRVLHHFLNHDCACPGPHGYRKNPERGRWHLYRFLDFLMEMGRVQMPAEIDSGARVVESFLQTLMAQGYVPESIAAYRKRCRHFIVWLYLHEVTLPEVDDDVFLPFPFARLHLCASPLLHQDRPIRGSQQQPLKDRAVHRVPDRHRHRRTAPDAGVRGTRPLSGAIRGLAAALSRHR